MTKHFWKKMTCSFLAVAIVAAGIPTWLLGMTVAAGNDGNYIKNPSFEDTDGNAVPDYSPNDWSVTAGWFINADPSAQDGSRVMIAQQNASATQTVSLPDGNYNFSGYLNAAGAGIQMSITLTSGSNSQTVSAKSGDTAGYQTIDRFAVTGGSVTVKLEAAFETPFTSSAVIDDLELTAVSSNKIKNPSFEETDGNAVPDYSPNDWSVTSGWFINADPSAQDGSRVMIAQQNASATQTVSLPDGNYNFSGYLNAAGAGIQMSITLTSGSNSQTVSAKSGDTAGYQTIDRFAVTGGSVTVKLEAAFETPFTSSAVIDDLELIDCSTIPTPQVTVTYQANGGIGTMAAQDIDEGVATALAKNRFTYPKYTFTGWNTQADGNGIAYTNEQSVTLTEDLTLYAQWQPAVIPGPDTVAFTPDDLTIDTDKRSTYKDNELNWYTDELLYNGTAVLDGSRVFDYDDSSAASDWQKMENNFVRKDTDDNYAAALMFQVGHPLADRNYDIIYKDLQVPVKGGKFSYYLWLRNGLPMNHNVFATAAIAYDKEGNAYNLGVSDVLRWSGDERYFTTPDDPNVAAMAGWYHYEAAMPKDVEIVKIGIMLTKTDVNSDAVIGPSFVDTEGKYGVAGETYWPGEDWTPVDEISFIDTIVCDDNIIFDDELKWESEQAQINEMGEYLNPWCMYDDKTIELDCTFNSLGMENTNIIYRDLDKGAQGGTFNFKLYNCTNSYLDGEAKYKVSVVGYDKDGKKVELGDCTDSMDGTDYLKFSGLPQTAYVYNGYNNCSVKLPADKILKRLEIHITETTEASVASALFMLDDVKFIDSSFVTLDSDNDKDKDEDKDNESKADENPAQNEDNTDTGVAMPIGMMVVVILVSAGALIITKGKIRDEK